MSEFDLTTVEGILGLIKEEEDNCYNNYDSCWDNGGDPERCYGYGYQGDILSDLHRTIRKANADG